ncbi:MAG: DUF4397 domain-containing protein [Bacteroidota bacterium]
MKKILYTSACLLAFAIGGCTKNVLKQTSNPATGAQLKFVQGVAGIPAVDEFVNGSKISPVQNLGVTDNSKPTSVITGIAYPSVFNTALQYGAMFPGGSSTNYAAVAAGSTTIKITTSTPLPLLVSPQTVAVNTTIATVTQPLNDRTPYTLFTMGYPDKVTALLVQDKFTGTDTTKAYIRFANLVPNNTTAIDLKATYTIGTATTVTEFTATPYGTVTDFIPVPVAPLGLTGYVFTAYNTGTATTVGAAAKSISLGANRYYTIVVNGLSADYPVPGTSITLKASARPTAPTNPSSLLPEIYFNPPGISYYTSK